MGARRPGNGSTADADEAAYLENEKPVLAMFLALGGTSWAVATGTIGTREIKNNSVRSSDIRNGAIQSRDVERGSLGGRAIKESSLGRVPGASRVGGKTAGQLTVRCPAGTVPDLGACIETTYRQAQAFGFAKNACNEKNRRLPSYQELAAIVDDSPTALGPGGELTSEVYPPADSRDSLNVLTIINQGGETALTPNTFDGRRPFRCVATPSNG